MTKSEKERLHKLASNNELRQVINILLELDASHSEYIALSAKLTECERDARINTVIPANLDVKRSQILMALLELIKQIEVVDPETQPETILVNEKTDTDGESTDSLITSHSIEIDVVQVVQIETQPETTDETGETSTAGEVNDSFSTSNSNEMDAYKFYFAIRDQLVGFIEDSDNRRLGIYQDDQDTVESVSQMITVLSKLQKHLKVNQLSSSLLFEVVEEALTMLVTADEELMNLVLGQKISTNGLKLKIINIQKKLADIVSEIDKKLQIDTASEG